MEACGRQQAGCPPNHLTLATADSTEPSSSTRHFCTFSKKASLYGPSTCRRLLRHEGEASESRFALLWVCSAGPTSLWGSPAGVAQPGGTEGTVLQCPACPTSESEGSCAEHCFQANPERLQRKAGNVRRWHEVAPERDQQF